MQSKRTYATAGRRPATNPLVLFSYDTSRDASTVEQPVRVTQSITQSGRCGPRHDTVEASREESALAVAAPRAVVGRVGPYEVVFGTEGRVAVWAPLMGGWYLMDRTGLLRSTPFDAEAETFALYGDVP